MAAPLVNVYYTKPIMPDVSRVLACLYEKKIEFEPIDIYEGQHSVSLDLLRLRSRASRRIHGAAIEDGDTRLFESRAICRYLAEKYGNRGTSLLGKNPLERASIEQWLKFEEHKFDPPSWALAFYLGFAPPPPDAAAVKDGVRKLAEVLDVYEQRLADSEFLAGNEFTMADLFHLPNSHHILSSGSSHKAYPEVCDLFSSRKNVSRWWKTISGRPSWKNVVDLLNGAPVQRTSLLASAPESLEIRQPSSSPPQFSKATRAKIMAEVASQLGLPPPSQPTDQTSPAKTSTKQGVEADPAISQRSKTRDEEDQRPSPPSDPHRPDFSSTSKDTAKAAPQARPQTAELAQGPQQSKTEIRDSQITRSSPPNPESQSPASSLSAMAGFEMPGSETWKSKSANKVERKSGENSPAPLISSQSALDGEKASPQTAIGSRQIPGTDGGSPTLPDSTRSPPLLPKNGTEEATKAITKPSSEKPKFKGDSDESTKVDKAVAPQPPGPSFPPPGAVAQAARQAGNNSHSNQAAATSGASHSSQRTPDDTNGSRSNKVGGAAATRDIKGSESLKPVTEIDSSSLLSSLAKEEANAASQAGNRSAKIPGKDGGNPPTTDSQRPSSALSSRKETAAATQPTTKPSTEKQELSGDVNGPPTLQPPGSSPSPAAGAQAARQAGNSSSAQSTQAAAATGSTPSSPGTLSGGSASSSNQAGDEGDAPNTPSTDTDP